MAAVAATWPGPMSATDGDLASGSEEDEGRGRGPKHESGRRWQLLERFLSSYEPTTPCSRRSNMPEQRNLILLRPFCNLLNLGVAKSTNQQQVYGNPAATATLIFDKGIYAGSNTFALPSEQAGKEKNDDFSLKLNLEKTGNARTFLQDESMVGINTLMALSTISSSVL
ncbi:uncharacterized protein [Miscanthus floridulus]|uniref:uncharacterized protein isoform X4 n=1 Tax=Miscanthus floridulus TaxID=154761 RepID=UPI00345A7FDF